MRAAPHTTQPVHRPAPQSKALAGHQQHLAHGRTRPRWPHLPCPVGMRPRAPCGPCPAQAHPRTPQASAGACRSPPLQAEGSPRAPPRSPRAAQPPTIPPNRVPRPRPQEGWKLNRQTVVNFLLLVEAGYSAQPYHNNVHATDVTQTAAIILHSLAQQVEGGIPKLDVFSVIMASCIHDLGHLGVNNDFLINTRHPRATTYNDKSVNENFHVARAFELARTVQGCDVFEQFTHEEQKQVRRGSMMARESRGWGTLSRVE